MTSHKGVTRTVITKFAGVSGSSRILGVFRECTRQVIGDETRDLPALDGIHLFSGETGDRLSLV